MSKLLPNDPNFRKSNNEEDIQHREKNLREKSLMIGTCIQGHKHSEKKGELDSVINALLSGSKDVGDYPILACIEKHLHLFGLKGVIDAMEVFTETYTRAVKKIESGEIIPNIPAWFRTTSYNVVRELSKSEKQQTNFIPNKLKSSNLDIELSAIDSLEELRIEIDFLFNKAKKIPPLDLKILVLQAKGYSFKEIAKRMIDDGDASEANTDKLIQNIRKRSCRAKKKLRDIHSHS